MSVSDARNSLWRWPILLAVATILGLPAALLGGDGWARWLCWALMLGPLVVIARTVMPFRMIRKRGR